MGVVLTKSGRGPKIFVHALRAVVILPRLKFNPSYALGYSVVIVNTLHKHMKGTQLELEGAGRFHGHNIICKNGKLC